MSIQGELWVNNTTTAHAFDLGNGYCIFEDPATTTPNMTMGACN